MDRFWVSGAPPIWHCLRQGLNIFVPPIKNLKKKQCQTKCKYEVYNMVHASGVHMLSLAKSRSSTLHHACSQDWFLGGATGTPRSVPFSSKKWTLWASPFPLDSPTKNPFLTHFVTKSWPFGRFRVMHPPPGYIAALHGWISCAYSVLIIV